MGDTRLENRWEEMRRKPQVLNAEAALLRSVERALGKIQQDLTSACADAALCDEAGPTRAASRLRFVADSGHETTPRLRLAPVASDRRPRRTPLFSYILAAEAARRDEEARLFWIPDSDPWTGAAFDAFDEPRKSQFSLSDDHRLSV
jgi:hypothetical protein